MAVKPKPRTVLEPLAESATDSPPIKSLSLVKLSDEVTLIYLGTTTGSLFSYSLRLSDSTITFVNRVSLPGGSSLNSIHPLGHLGKIIIHGDSFLFLTDFGLVEPVRRVSLFKGVTAFARKLNCREDVHSSLFAVGLGKKLVLAELILSGSLVIVKEVYGVIEGSIMTVLWVDDSVFVGTKGGYYLYDCKNGQCALMFTLPDDLLGVPRMSLLVRDVKVLLMVDNVGVIVDMDGQPVGGSLVFQEAPDSLREIGSYVVALKSLTVELYHKKNGCCVQRFKVAGERPCLLADEEKGTGKIIVVATRSKVFVQKCFKFFRHDL